MYIIKFMPKSKEYKQGSLLKNRKALMLYTQLPTNKIPTVTVWI